MLADGLVSEAGLNASQSDDERLNALLRLCDDLAAFQSVDEEQKDASLAQVLQSVMALHEFLKTRPAAMSRLLSERGVKAAKAGANPYVTVVKIVFGDDDRSTVTRYAATLRAAAEHQINSTGLPDFMKAHGGVVGCQRLDRKAHPTAAKDKADQKLEDQLENHRNFGVDVADPILGKLVTAPLVSLLVEPMKGGKFRVLGTRVEDLSALPRFQMVSAQELPASVKTRQREKPVHRRPPGPMGAR